MKVVLFIAWMAIVLQEESLLGTITTANAETILDATSPTAATATTKKKELLLKGSKTDEVVSAGKEDALKEENLSSSSVSLRDNIPKGLEDFYKPVATMTKKERLNAVEHFYEEFKKAAAELSDVDLADEFPKIEGLFQKNLEDTESMSNSISSTINYLRSAASLRRSGGRGDDWQDEDDMLEGEVDEDEDVHYDLQARLPRKLKSLPYQGEEDKKMGDRRSELPRSSRKRETVGRNKSGNPFSSSFKDDTSFARKFVESLPYGPRPSDNLFRSLLQGEANEDSRKSRGDGHRQLKTKNEKCEQLAECASRMSLYDLFVSFHSDDIDPVTGAFDANIVFFDEVDIVEIAARISEMASDILDNGSYDLCDSLLEEFHRTVEFEGVPEWEGATISQVCLAQGTTAFMDYASLYQALVPDLPEEEELELELKKLNFAIQIYMQGGGTDFKLRKIFDALFKIYEALSLPRRLEAFNLVNLLAQESFGCAEKLFNSPDRTGNPAFTGNRNVLARSDTNPFGEQTIRPSTVTYGSGGRGTDFDDNTFLSGFVGNINSITVYYDDEGINGLKTTYARQGGDIETISHGPALGSEETISFAVTPLIELSVWQKEVISSQSRVFLVVGIEFRDSKGRTYGPYGRTEAEFSSRPVFRRPAFVGDEREAIIGFRGEARSTSGISQLGVYYQANAVFDFFSKPTVGYDIPTGVDADGAGRTEHGQIIDDGVSSFSFTSTFDLLQDYGSCLNTFIGPIRGLVQIFERVHGLGNVQNLDGFDPCDNDPNNPSFICQALNGVGLLPVEDQNPFLCGPGGIVSYDGSFCCTSTDFCSTSTCGRHCPTTDVGFFPFVPLLERKLCCEEDIRRNSFECSDSTHKGCKIPKGERWYDIAFRVASEQFLEAIDSEKTCASDYFEAVQYGLQLVLGERTSAPGFVCGIANAVVDEGKPLPGTCCLDAPYELTDENWGLSYDCSIECQNRAPYIAGMSEETCDVFGGTWCANPTDCTVLQDCIADLMATIRDEPRLQAFAMYLGAAPNITDPTDSDQCGSTREFFGFDAGFINDVQICDDIEQLRFSRDLQFLQEFLGVGAEGMSQPTTQPPLADVPPLELIPPDRTVSESAPVQNGQAWRATNFVLQKTLEKLDAFQQNLAMIECFLDPKFAKANICLGTKNSLLKAQMKAVAAAKLIHAISEFTYGELAEIDNVGELTILENTNALFENMGLTGTYLQERFMDLNELIRGDNTVIKEDLGVINGRLELILNDTIETRKLQGVDQDENVHQRGEKMQLPSENSSKNKNSNHDLHQVQVEIISSIPKKFVCGVVRHRDAGTAPELLGVKTLDSITEATIPLTEYYLVSLGEGRILVTIPDSIDSNVFFVNLGLKLESSDEIIAEHSMIVNFLIKAS